jgi:hypothetical protein
MSVGRLHKSRILIRSGGPGTATPFLLVPIDHLDVRAIPYVGSGRTTVELFDGREKFLLPKFKYRVTLTWNEMSPREADVLSRLVKHVMGFTVTGDVDMALQPVSTITPAAIAGRTYLYFDDADLTRAIEVVPNLSEDTVRLTYDKRARKKPAQIEFISTTPVSQPPFDWLIIDD